MKHQNHLALFLDIKKMIGQVKNVSLKMETIFIPTNSEILGIKPVFGNGPHQKKIPIN